MSWSLFKQWLVQNPTFSVDYIGKNYINEMIVDMVNFSQLQARKMFDGEFVSLDVLHAMETIRVPKPIKVTEFCRNAILSYLM